MIRATYTLDGSVICKIFGSNFREDYKKFANLPKGTKRYDPERKVWIIEDPENCPIEEVQTAFRERTVQLEMFK